MPKRDKRDREAYTPDPAFIAARRLMYADIMPQVIMGRAIPDPAEMKAALAARASDPLSESRIVLGAWSHLRKLGEKPPAKVWNDVLGVVMEVGFEGGESYAAAGYADGSAELLFSNGGGFTGDMTLPEVADAAKALVTAARRPPALFRTETVHPLPRAEQVRLVLLTPGGNRAAEESEEAVQAQDHPLHPILALAVELLTAFRLMNDDEDEEDASDDLEDDD